MYGILFSIIDNADKNVALQINPIISQSEHASCAKSCSK